MQRIRNINLVFKNYCRDGWSRGEDAGEDCSGRSVGGVMWLNENVKIEKVLIGLIKRLFGVEKN